MPQLQMKRPFSWKNPSRELQPVKPSASVYETSQKRITRPSIQPNGDLVHRGSHGRLEDVIQLSQRILCIDWDIACIHFADIKGDFGQRSDLVSCMNLAIGTQKLLVGIVLTLSCLRQESELGMR